MNKLLITAFVFIVHYSLLITLCYAQFQPDVRLTNDPATSFTSDNNAWCITSSGNFVHVVWRDIRDANREIYYKRSTDGGITFGSDVRLTNDLSFSQFPSVAVSGSVVHIVWYDERDNLNGEIYYKRSTDAGVTFGADIRLTNNTAVSGNPSIAVSGSIVHVVWYDERDANREIYYKHSTDGGTTFGVDTRLTNNTAVSDIPSVAVSGTIVHIVWEDNRDVNDQIYYKRSTDGGTSWGTDVRLTNSTTLSQRPSVAVSGSVVYVVWQDNRDGNSEIYYKRSTDGGVTFGADIRLTNNSAISERPSVAVSGSVMHIVWQDNRDGNSEIYYKRSTDGGVTFGADTRLTNNTAVSQFPSVAVSGSFVHVAWQDNRDGNFEIYYKRDPTGNVVGIININTEIPKDFSLSQNYPNPFNPGTKIQFALPKSTFVKIAVYDMLGKEIETIVNRQLNTGTYEADFDGSKFASGVYYYRIAAEGYTKTMKMIIVK